MLWMGKSTISMAIFQFTMLVHQRVIHAAEGVNPPTNAHVDGHPGKSWLHNVVNPSWLVVWNIFIHFLFFPYVGNNHHPNWRSQSFQRGWLKPPTSINKPSPSHQILWKICIPSQQGKSPGWPKSPILWNRSVTPSHWYWRIHDFLMNHWFIDYLYLFVDWLVANKSWPSLMLCGRLLLQHWTRRSCLSLKSQDTLLLTLLLNSCSFKTMPMIFGPFICVASPTRIWQGENPRFFSWRLKKSTIIKPPEQNGLLNLLVRCKTCWWILYIYIYIYVHD